MVFTIDIPFYIVYIQYMTNTNRIQTLPPTHDRTLGLTRITLPSGEHVVVSTVDLQMRGYGGRYETMVFRSDVEGKVLDWLELQCNRYDTVQDAARGHADIVAEWLAVDRLTSDR